jgi:dTDP-4-dehydrorhamnose 3,5-epimerase
MNIIKTDIDGVLIIEPRLFRDARGYFFESFSEREFGISPLQRKVLTH